MRLLVTGGGGFVGSWLSEIAATDYAWEGVVILRLFSDLLDREALTAEVRECRPDAVIHLAALSSVAEALRDPSRTAAINVLGTLYLLDALESQGFRGRFLFVGSSEVYGAVPAEGLPIVEETPLAPRNPYAASKAAAEMFVLERARRGKLRAVCARSFNHAGPRQDGRFVLSSLARQVAAIGLGRMPPEICAGDLDVTRDFLDVRDVIEAYRVLLQKGEAGKTYNVCGGREYRLADLLDALMGMAGVVARVSRNPALTRPAEQRRMRGDNGRLRALGWEPRVAMTDTLRAMLDYWRNELEKEAK